MIYIVPQVISEIGYGVFDNGFKTYESLEECIFQIKLLNKQGWDGDYYKGPKLPLGYYIDSVENNYNLILHEI